MATIDDAVAVGISAELAKGMFEGLSQAEFDAAVKVRQKEAKKNVDHLAKFKEAHGEIIANVTSGLTTLKQHIADYNAANTKAKLAFDPVTLVKENKRTKRTGTSDSNGPSAKASEKKAASLARVTALHAHYGDSRLNFRGIRGTLIAEGKVRTPDKTFDSIGKWATSLKVGGMADMWKTVAIDTGDGGFMPLGQAEQRIPRQVPPPMNAAVSLAAPVETTPEPTSKKK